jgi:hypothetical protein
LGGDRIKVADTDKIHHDFGELQFKVGECIEDFALRVTALANRLRALGEKVLEKDVIKKLLLSILEHLEQVAISIKTLLNLNSMRIVKATDHLRAVEERK